MSSAEHALAFEERGSLLNRIYPLVKLAWVVLVAIGLFIYKTPYSGGVMFVLLIAFALTAGKVPFKTILGSSQVILMLGLLLMVFHFFTDPGEEAFRIGPLVATQTGLIQGPVFFFRLSVIVLASFILIWTTDTRDLMVSLTKAGMPYRFAFAVFLAMRFLPLIQREIDAVKSAHSIRGRAAHSSLGHRIKLWQRYIFTVLINGLRKAETTSVSLETRGFGAYPTRTYVKDVTFHASDLWLIVVTFLLSGGLIAVERLVLGVS